MLKRCNCLYLRKDKIYSKVLKVVFIDDGICGACVPTNQVQDNRPLDLITTQVICEFIDTKSEGMELDLTGRKVPDQIAERADLITEMKPIKHCIAKAVPVRIGIES